MARLILEQLQSLRDRLAGVSGSGDIGRPLGDTVEEAISEAYNYFSTTLIEFDGLSINADPTLLDIGAGKAKFVTQNLDGTTTVSAPLTWTAQTFDATDTPPFDNNALAYVTVNSSGVFEMNLLPLDFDVISSKVPLGFLRIEGGVITVVSQSLFFGHKPQGLAQAFNEYIEIIGFQNLGIGYIPNADLTFQLTGGDAWKPGANWLTDRLNNKVSFTTQDPVTFFYSYRNGTGGYSTSASRTLIDGKSLDDDSGTFPNTIVNNNNWSNQRIYLAPTENLVFVELGQTEHNNSANAVAAINTEGHIANPALRDAMFIGILSVRGAASDLSISGDAVFTPATAAVGVSAAASAVTLQDAYINTGLEPEITTNVSRGAFSVKRGSAADTDNIYEGQDGTGTVTFAITGEGQYANQLHHGVNSVTESANIVIDCNDGNVHSVTPLTANRILDAFINPKAGSVYYVIFKQDAIGGHTLDVSAFKTIGGVAPVLTSAANAIDIYTFLYDGTDTFLIETQDFQ